MNYEHFFIDDNDDSDDNNTNTNRRQRSLRNRRVRELVGENSKFLDDFDPEKSTRERRKLTRRTYITNTNSRTSLFDEKGRYRHNLVNVCDCLDNTCPGCHFPCPQCRSPKCATTCRVNRKWAFEVIEHDGKDLVIKNKNMNVK